MKKIALVIISILFLSGVAYGQEESKDGVIKEYYESGKLKSEANYKNGKKDGIEKLYYDSGQLMSERNFKGGVTCPKEYVDKAHLKTTSEFIQKLKASE